MVFRGVLAVVTTRSALRRNLLLREVPLLLPILAGWRNDIGMLLLLHERGGLLGDNCPTDNRRRFTPFRNVLLAANAEPCDESACTAEA
jgi:hypothetical protein